jgi:uncharacterized protein YjiS (DUF1127 family)
MRRVAVRPAVSALDSLRGAAAALGAVATGLLRRRALWGALRAERRELARLDARLLRDIGVGEGDAAREAARPFWDVPAGRG